MENLERVKRIAPFLEKEYEGNVRDLLADLRHYCDAKHVDFDDEARIASEHYSVEFVESMTATTSVPTTIKGWAALQGLDVYHAKQLLQMLVMLPQRYFGSSPLYNEEFTKKWRIETVTDRGDYKAFIPETARVELYAKLGIEELLARFSHYERALIYRTQSNA